jgi:micrococcal nuclease
VRIRLYGINAPEMGQDFGRKAKDFASSMVGNKMDTDRYGRTVAIILVDGKNLNEELIRAGLAWVYPQYCKATFCSEWYKLEDASRKAKIGLWSHPGAIPPWEYRRGGKAPRKAPQEAVGAYHGNVSSMVFHGPNCRDYNCKNCTAVFRTREEAIEAGFRACGSCNP